jgi:YD repeat-containing protein
MDRRQLLLGMTALGLTRNLTLPDFLNAQNVEIGDSLLSTNSVNTSDRERDGLRGPVRISLEEVGSDFGKTRTTNEYDLDGRLLASKSTYSGGSEWENTRTYDAAGRLLRTSNKSDGSSSVQIYSYDERGRLLSTADSNGSRTDFHYDSEGRKTEKQTIPPRPGEMKETAVGLGAVAGAMEGGYGLYDGGTVTKRYDDHDLPIESKVLDSEGNLVSRVIRSYDSKGRLTAERMIPENWEIGLAKQMLAKAPEEYRTEEGLRQVTEHLKPMMKAFGRDTEKSYTYDAQNRITETHMQSSFWCQDTKIEYNDHGDIIEQQETLARGSSTLPFGVPFHQDEAGNLVPDKPQSELPAQPDLLPRSSLVRYAYEYDSQGNWTEQTRILQDGSTSTTRRNLTYY